jgi:hypothetical protein
MDKRDASEGGFDTLSEFDLSRRWQSLIKRLWEPNEPSIIHFLPEIVAAIKETSNSMAERALLNVLHSPKVQDMKPRLRTPSVVVPGYQLMREMADAADLSLGEDRTNAIANLNERSKVGALTPGEIMDALNAHSEKKPPTDSAKARRGRRARKKLGISRKVGAPRKTGQK